MIAIDLSKPQAFNVYPKEIQQIKFVGGLARDPKCKYNNIFHYRRSERNYFKFSTRNFESIVDVVVGLSYCRCHNLFWYNIISV